MALPVALAAVRVIGSGAARAFSAASPALKEGALSLLSRATGGRINTEAKAIESATASKGSLALFAINAAKAGLRPADMFGDLVIDQGMQAEFQALKANVIRAYNESYKPVDASASIRELNTPSEMIMGLNVVNYIMKSRGLYNAKAVREAHMYDKLFYELDEQVLSDILATKAAA